MKRLRMLGAALVVLALAPSTGVVAGPPDTFLVEPSSGPSPNTVTVSGQGCFFEEQSPFRAGGVTLAGGAFGGLVNVQIRNKADTASLHSDSFVANNDGTWSESFPIPAGLSPGVYPMKASCSLLNGQVEGAGLVLGGANGGFAYDSRTYTVVAKSKKAKAVDADVSFTG